MLSSISYITLFSVFGLINSNSEPQYVPLYVSGGVLALETYYKIFHELRAELISNVHEWTEGPLTLPQTSQMPNKDILLFSDTIQDLIWIYEEAEGKLGEKPKVLIENSGNCPSARSECHLVAEPGSNGMSIDAFNKNLLICQHGARAISKLSLNHSSHLPIDNNFEVSIEETIPR